MSDQQFPWRKVWCGSVTIPGELQASGPPWDTGSQPPGTTDGLVGLLRDEHAALKHGGSLTFNGVPFTYDDPTAKPQYILCGNTFYWALRDVLDRIEHRRVMLWKYRKLRGMPLPA